MQEKVMEQVEALEVFFATHNEGKNLNVTQEILYALIEMIDLRDDATVTADSLGRLSLIVGKKFYGSEDFVKEYFVKTSTFVALYLQSISETMHTAQEWELQNMMQECSSFLSSKLPEGNEHRVMHISLKALINKIELLAKDPTFAGEEIVEAMQQQLTIDNLEALSMLEPSQSIAMILGSVISVISVMSQMQQ